MGTWEQRAILEGTKRTPLGDPLFSENVFRIQRRKGYVFFQVIDVSTKRSSVNLPSSLTSWKKKPLLPRPGLPHGLPYAWSSPRTTLWNTPLLLREKTIQFTHKNLLAFTITFGCHIGSYNLWAYSSLVSPN